MTPAFGDLGARGARPSRDAVVMRLSDGSSAVVDVILVAAGGDPRDGMPVDLAARGPGRPARPTTDSESPALDRVYAAGDVARVHRGEEVVRGEHWGYAMAQGRHAARVAGPRPGPGRTPARSTCRSRSRPGSTGRR